MKTKRFIYSSAPSTCCGHNSLLVQSRDGGFISRDCLKCGRSDYVRPDQMPDLHCEFCDAPLAVKKADGVNSQTSADTAKRLKDKIDGCDRVLVKRHDPQFEPGIIIAQTPQGGERVDCGTVIGVTLSAEDPWR